MMFWERRANPGRSQSLRILATGFTTLAVGCAVVLVRRSLPEVLGSAVANLIMLSGYLLVLGGVASLRGRRYRAASFGLLVAMALVWIVAGARWHDVIWCYISAFPLALVSAATAWEMLRCEAMKPLHSRYIVVVVTGVHAVLYTGRAFVLPWLVAAYGPSINAIASNVTLYEGVLYSVLLPMALIRLVREETHGQLLLESQTDYLTRLGNRRWFFEQGTRILNGGASGPVSVLAFDLDHFKAINDLYGHQTGDKVLKSFADTARSVVGPDAILARIGGEEFAALLSGHDAVRAQSLGETVARLFAETTSSRTDNLGVPATVSVGLAHFEDEVPALVEGLAAADQALYRAKSLGGNRLELAQAGLDPLS